jgi:hypothetical protein
VGKRADLLLVRGDPRTDITHTRDIVGVWKQGQRFDREPLRAEVERAREQLARMRATPPPAGLGDGLVSDFDDGTLATHFGSGWAESTDRMRGGSSSVSLTVVGVRPGRGKAMRVAGTIDGGSSPIAWSGAMFLPGAEQLAPANLVSAPRLSFRSRGDGPLQILVFSTRGGIVPASTTVEIGPTWSEHRIDLRTLVADPFDVTGIYFGAAARAGAFSFELDDVRLAPAGS